MKQKEWNARQKLRRISAELRTMDNDLQSEGYNTPSLFRLIKAIRGALFNLEAVDE